MNREKLAQTLRKVIEDRNARTLGERSEVYSAARASFRKATHEEPAALADVDDIIEEIETAHAPKPATEKKSGEKTGGGKVVFFRLVAGAILGGLATAVAMMFGLGFQPSNPVAATLLRQYNQTVPLLPTAIDYLHKVADRVAEMQKNDPTTLEAKASHKFVGVNVIDPGLAKNMPRSLPHGSWITVRANASDYKILFNWTLCGVARLEKPKMVDPVRSKTDMLGCRNFGLWTPGAAKW